MTKSEDVWSVEEAAAYLGLNRKTVYEMVRDGDMPGALKFRGTIRIHKPTMLASFADGLLPPKKRRRASGSLSE